MEDLKTYNDQIVWKEIHRYLPEHNRISEEVYPQEIFIEWKRSLIHLDYYVNKEAPAKVIILHGVGGNGRLLSFIGVPLYKSGFEVIAPDLPGYGYSQVTKEMICFTYWIELVDHLIEIEQQKDGRPIIVFGLSAGGILAYHASAKNRKVKGLIATNLLDQRIREVRDFSSGNVVVSRLGIPILNALESINGNIMLPMKALANMKAIVNHKEVLKLLLSDPTSSGTKVPLRFVRSLLNASPEVEPEDFHVCPVLLVHPECDKWTPVEISKLFFDRIKAPKELRILNNAGHFPIEAPGLQQLEDYIIEFIHKCIKE